MLGIFFQLDDTHTRRTTGHWTFARKELLNKIMFFFRMLKNFTPRIYQESIFNTCTRYNTLVVLPTGLGKTNIFLMTAAFKVQQYPNSKILLLGPTRPLIKQYFDVFVKYLEINPDDMAIFTGSVKPEKREELWKKSKIIFSTPQGLENDIINKRINFEDVSLLGIDEAHRAVGNYSYVWLSKQYLEKANYPRVVAMTASPGAELEHIQEVCNNLGIEEIEVRTENDPDVMPYMQQVDISYVSVKLPEELAHIRKCFQIACSNKSEEIKQLGFSSPIPLDKASRKDLLGFQGQLHGELASGNRSHELLKSVSLMAEIMKLQHALELIETQGVNAVIKYISHLEEEAKTTKVKATQNVVVDSYVRMAMAKCLALNSQNIEHPKLNEIKKIIDDLIVKNPNAKFIVFSQFRDTIAKLVSIFNTIPNIKAQIFVGQANKKDTGLSQKQQLALLQEFRDGKFNVLVSSSVGEEGLDIPTVDTVIFYEPVPSAIRHIQRKGRTARNDKGSVIVLMTKDTRDEAYRWSAFHKERKMHRLLKDLKSKLKVSATKINNGAAKQTTLLEQPTEDYMEKIAKKPIKIYADSREKGNTIVKELIDMGADVKLEKLEIGDYLASNRVGIEFKTIPDFVQSVIDGRLLPQLIELRRSFEKPILIVEGTENIYGIRNIHPNALQGMLVTIAVSFSIPILFTKTNKESAQIIATIARREQDEDDSPPNLHTSRKPISIKELQEYIISAFPGIGATLANPILKEFKTIKNLANASEEQIMNIANIGLGKAKKIREVLDTEYKE